MIFRMILFLTHVLDLKEFTLSNFKQDLSCFGLFFNKQAKLVRLKFVNRRLTNLHKLSLL